MIEPMRRSASYVVLGTALMGCAVPGAGSKTKVVALRPDSASARKVAIVNRAGENPFGYSPSVITVRVGTRVVWRNRSSTDHTVTDAGDHVGFNSGVRRLIHPGARWSYVFHHAGTYRYYCVIHPFMKGRVIVRP